MTHRLYLLQVRRGMGMPAVGWRPLRAHVAFLRVVCLAGCAPHTGGPGSGQIHLLRKAGVVGANLQQ